jgi:vancomycin resistance protein YoaR
VGVEIVTPNRRILVVVLSAVAGLLVVLWVVAALGSGSTAPAGTTVAGIDIGGMNRAEAEEAVTAALGERAERRLRVEALDQSFTVLPQEAGLGLDAVASVAPAFEHTWNPIALVGRMLGGAALPAVASVDEEALDAQLAGIADAIAVAPVEPVLDIRRGQPDVTPGKPGRTLDIPATREALVAAVLERRAPVPAVVVADEPSVTPEAVDEAVAYARQALSAPVTVRAESVTAQLPIRAIGRALSFRVADGRLEPVLDGALLRSAIKDELAPVEIPGRDATFRIRNGNVRVVKSKVGRGIEDDDLARAVSGVLGLPAGQRTVTVPVGLREPELTTEQARQLGITERISTFTQRFPYAAYRVQNLGQAAERINGTLLMPGDTFSLNDTILERTEENGYTVGFVVGEGGIFDEQLGGGVSASATTTWTAAFYAGMERVQVIPHSIYISRYQPGLEATVAWGIFDMSFRNDSPNAVFITASITNTSMTVSFWGTPEYDRIEADFGPRRNIKKFATIYDTSKTCLGQSGVEGFTITVDRVFYQDGEEVRREPITTTYKPAPEVICGEKPKKPKPDPDAPGPSASPSPTPAPSTSVAPDGTMENTAPSPSSTGKPRVR